eukprot:m.13088 g.13088  ORF g.13088 m.13088 type:complete len:547 (+) comp6746_c0_seq1:278-1918(+)
MSGHKSISAEDEDWEDFNSSQHIKRASVVVPENDEDDLLTDKFQFSFRKLWLFTGPGFLMSIAYLDPGNLESDLQAGAVAGYQLLWVLFWATGAGLFLQLLAARLAVVTGLNLGQMCRHQYSRPVRYAVWVMMEIAIIGSDIQEVIGSAIAINLLSNGAVDLWAGALITAVDTFIFLFLEQYGLRKLEAFFAALITTMSITFGYMYIISKPDQAELMKGLVVPMCDQSNVEQAVGLLGAIIMPHNLYLHSALVLSRTIDTSNKRRIREANFYYAVEGAIALGVSFIINMFVVTVFAKAFFRQPYVGDDGTLVAPDDIDLLISGEALNKRYGAVIKYIWALGLLAAGQSSTMTGTYAGQFVMEGFLRIRMAPWKRVTFTRTIALGPTLLVSLFASKTTWNTMSEFLNVLQSVQLPFALIPVLHFTSVTGLMGPFVNGPIIKTVGWFLSISVIAINIYTVIDQISSLPSVWYVDLPIAVVGVAYSLFVGYLMFGPWMPFGSMRGIYKSFMRTRADIQLHYERKNLGEDERDPLLGHEEDTTRQSRAGM